MVVKKSVPCTLLTPFQSEASAAVDDVLSIFLASFLILLRLSTFCWWKVSEIMFPSVSKCAAFTSPFGGSYVSR